MKNLAVILVAGGKGERMGCSFPKQFMLLGGKPILMHTIERFAATFPKSRIIVALHGDYVDHWRELCQKYNFTTAHTICCGGETRFHTVSNALKLIEKADLVAIHDGVRPLVDGPLIERAVRDAKAYGAVVPAIRPVDSMREVIRNGNRVVDRNDYRMIQTPQVFRAKIITEAYDCDYDPSFTDDAGVVEAAGGNVYFCEGSDHNIKITSPIDLVIAEALLAHLSSVPASQD